MKNASTLLVFLCFVPFLQAHTHVHELLFSKINHELEVHPQAGDITVLFAYTKHAAKEIGGGAPEIKRQVDYGMNLLNEVLKNSNVGYQARAIPQFVEVDFDQEVKDARDLLKKLGDPQGKFNKLHQIRKQKQGDILCLIFEGKKKGIANLYGDLMVCNISTFDDSYVFPHELGHNLGAVHSNKDGEPYLRTYHFKYRDNGYRTVSNNGGISIPYFSEDRTITHDFKYQDPDDNYKWKTEKKTIKLGDENYDNAEDAKVYVYSSYILENDLATAETYLNSIQPETEQMTDFISLQQINLDRLPYGPYYDATTSELSTVEAIARKSHPYAAYGKALHYALTGEVISSDRPIIEGTESREGGIQDKKDEDAIMIYPNPFSDQLNIQILGFDDVRIEIHDFLGKSVFSSTFSKQNLVISTNHWNRGIYLVTVKSGKDILMSEKKLLVH